MFHTVSIAVGSALALIAICAHADTPSPDTRMTAITDGPAYSITIWPRDGEIPIARRHAWVVAIADVEGAPVEPTQLAFYGGMPGHGHGLPSTPRVTEELGPGRYLVEGVVFNMHGSWELVVGVASGGEPGKAVFPLELMPVPDRVVEAEHWSPAELALMQSLALPNRPSAPADPSNRLLGNPEAIALGQALFFDNGLSLNGDIACASCHDPRLAFTDGKARSRGSRELARNSPTLLGIAHGDWFYWDGRRDSVWAQALTPIETPGEMDNTRLAVVRYVMTHEAYGDVFQRLTNGLPDLERLPESAGPYGSADEKARWSALAESERRQVSRAFADIGKIVASYVSTLEPGASRFDRYVDTLVGGRTERILEPAEERGLRLFLEPEKTQCLRCHNGAYFTNFGFNNIGTGAAADGALPDFGRMIGLQAALVDEFNCLGRYSDADPAECDHHRFAAQNHSDNGAFKVPGLRNVVQTAPYMHDGRFETLGEVLEYYRSPPDREATNHELPPLELTDAELADLAAFLESLSEDANP